MRKDKIILETELNHVITKIKQLQLQQTELLSWLQEVYSTIKEDQESEAECPGSNGHIVTKTNNINPNCLEWLSDWQIEQMSDIEDSNKVVIIARTGDIVIIINAKKGQEKLGNVTGHWVDGKVKILKRKKKITRLPKNVRIVNDIDFLLTHNCMR